MSMLWESNDKWCGTKLSQYYFYNRTNICKECEKVVIDYSVGVDFKRSW